MAEQTIIPVSDEQFVLSVYHSAGRKSQGTLEERASLTDRELSHLAVYGRDDAERARRTRAQALEELERERIRIRAKALSEDVTPPRALALKDVERLSWREIVAKAPQQEVPITVEFLDALYTRLNQMNDRNKERNEKIAALEKRLGALEAQPAAKGINFRDTWNPTTSYDTHDVVTWGGSSFIARFPSVGVTPMENGYGSQGWAVLARRGKQGKTGDAS